MILADAERNENQQDKTGNHGEKVRNERDPVVHRTAYIAGDQTENQADKCGNEAGDEADHQRHAGGDYELSQHIAAEVVRAQGKHLHIGHLIDHDIGSRRHTIDLFQRAGLRVFLRDDGVVCGQQPANRIVEPDVIVALGIGHPGDGDSRVVRVEPLAEEGIRVFDVDLAFGDAGSDQPFFDGLAIFIVELGRNPVRLRALEVERVVLRAADTVVHVDINAGREERALTDDGE